MDTAYDDDNEKRKLFANWLAPAIRDLSWLDSMASSIYCRERDLSLGTWEPKGRASEGGQRTRRDCRYADHPLVPKRDHSM